MKTFLATCAATLLLLTTSTIAQEPSKDAKPPAAADAKTPDANPPKEESWPSDHTIKINNQSIAYKATASTTLLKDEKGEPTALIYSTAYTRSDTKDFARRPIAFIYNGGPGSASIWPHKGGLGPRRRPTPSSTTAAPAPHPSGCTWAPSARAASSTPTTPSLRPPPTKSKTTRIPCSIKPIWFSLTPSALASATPSAKLKIKISGASIRT